MEAITQRFDSLEFHYNDLMKKHKMCFECLNEQQASNDELRLHSERCMEERADLVDEKSRLEELFKTQIDQLDSNLKHVRPLSHSHV